MSSYLTFIGIANILGAFLLLAALSERVSDLLLRQWSYIIPTDTPYKHSAYGRLWLWWALIGTSFFGVLNVIAASWPPAYAKVVVYGDIYVYGMFELLAIAGSLSPRFGPGVHVAHFLWIGQGGWGVYVAMTMTG